VLLHARSWRPIVFASLLLASKVWHDVSYWNSDFSSICPMFNLRNINRAAAGADVGPAPDAPHLAITAAPLQPPSARAASVTPAGRASTPGCAA